MEPHPDFVDIVLPREFALGSFVLTPLTMDVVEEDFAAVQDTAHLMDGIFGDWPNGLTLEDNRVDLAWHDREFTTNRSFSWVIRNGGGRYLGCFYLFPKIGRRGHAKAALWFCEMDDRDTVASTLVAALKDWLVTHAPPDIEITWTTRPKLIGGT